MKYMSGLWSNMGILRIGLAILVLLQALTTFRLHQEQQLARTALEAIEEMKEAKEAWKIVYYDMEVQKDAWKASFFRLKGYCLERIRGENPPATSDFTCTSDDPERPDLKLRIEMKYRREEDFDLSRIADTLSSLSKSAIWTCRHEVSGRLSTDGEIVGRMKGE